MLVMWGCRAVRYVFVYKMSKLAAVTISPKKRTTKNKHSIVKLIGKKVVSKATSKYIYSRAIVQVFKEYWDEI